MINLSEYAVWGRSLLSGISLIIYFTTPLRSYMTELAFQELMRDFGNPPALLHQLFDVTPFNAGDYNQFVNYRHFLSSFKLNVSQRNMLMASMKFRLILVIEFGSVMVATYFTLSIIVVILFFGELMYWLMF